MRTFANLPHVPLAQERPAERLDAAVLGAPFDTATSYRPGARFGPEAIRALTAITGRHRLPPAWAQGPMLSRAVQNTGRESADTYAAWVSGS